MNTDSHLDLVDRLHRTGDAIPVTDTAPGLTDIRHRRSRQRQRHAAISVAAVAIITVTAIAGAVAILGADERDDTVVTATPPVPTNAPTTALVVATPDTTESEPTPTEEDGSPEIVKIESIVRPTVEVETFDALADDITASVPVIDDPPPPDWSDDAAWNVPWEFLVPWDDGFLLGRQVTIPPDLDIGPGEAFELMGEEMTVPLRNLDSFTPEAADVVLRDAGFGERLDELLAQEPDLLLAYFGIGTRFALDVHFSVDGTSWIPRQIDLPDDVNWVSGVAADGDRLALIGRSSGGTALRSDERSIWSTTDLSTWSEQQLDLPDPSVGFPQEYVRANTSVGDLRISSGGWVATVRAEVHLDDWRLIEDRLGSQPNGYSSQVVDGQLILDDFSEGTEAPIVIDLTELGFSEEQADQIGRSDRATSVWSAGWADDAGTRLDGFPLFWFGGTAVSETDVVMWTATELGVTEFDSTAVTVMQAPDIEYSIQTVRPVGDLLIVHTNRPADSDAVTYAVDVTEGTWTPLGIDGLPERPLTHAHEQRDQVMRFASRALPVTVPTQQTFEQGDYRYVERHEQPRTSYEVVRISTGEVVVSETIDIRIEGPVAGKRFEFLEESATGTRTVVDPATGETIIGIDDDDLEDFWATRTELDGTPVVNPTLDDFFPLDNVLAVLTDDPMRWMVHDVAEIDLGDPAQARYSSNRLIAVNGDTVIREEATGWYVHDLS